MKSKQIRNMHMDAMTAAMNRNDVRVFNHHHNQALKAWNRSLRWKNILVYAYLTFLSGLLILCSILLSIEPSNLTHGSIVVALSFGGLLVVIALIIVAPKPQRS